MELESIPIRAHIALLSTDEGGRKTALRGPVSYRPNHNFFDQENRDMCMGAIELADGQSLAPGDALDVDMTLLAWPALSKEIKKGRRWRLQEGAQLVGWGTVLEANGA